MDSDLIPVFVAVSQAGARQGQIRWVNADDPDIAIRLSLGYLQRLPGVAEAIAEIEPEAEPLAEDADEAGLVGE